MFETVLPETVFLWAWCFFSTYRSLPNDNQISDNKIRKMSKLDCHGNSQEKQRFETIVRKFPPPRPPPKRTFYQYCRFGVSFDLRDTRQSASSFGFLRYLVVWCGFARIAAVSWEYQRFLRVAAVSCANLPSPMLWSLGKRKNLQKISKHQLLGSVCPPWVYCRRRNYYWINSEKGGSSNF